MPSTEGCTSDSSVFDSCELAVSVFDSCTPGFCRRVASTPSGEHDFERDLLEIDQMLVEQFGIPVEELADECEIAAGAACKAAVNLDSSGATDSDSTSGCSSSSVSFTCDASKRERQGIELLGSEDRFRTFERLVTADVSCETIAIALDLAPEQIAFVVESLRRCKPGGEGCKRKSKTPAKAVRCRAVRSSQSVSFSRPQIPQQTETPSNQNQNPQEISSSFPIEMQSGSNETDKHDLKPSSSGAATELLKSVPRYAGGLVRTGAREGARVLMKVLAVATQIYLLVSCVMRSGCPADPTDASPVPRLDTSLLPRARPVTAEPNRVRPVQSPDGDLYYGFSDNGTEFLVRPPEQNDVVLGQRMLEGLDSHPVLSQMTDDEESTCVGETLVMIPSGTLQYRLGFKLSGEGSTQVYTRDDLRFVSRWKHGHFWFSRDDTEEIRLLLAVFWRARRGREAPAARETRPSYQLLGRLRHDFDKSEPWVHNFTRRMSDTGVRQDELRSMWDEARTVRYFSYLCRSWLLAERQPRRPTPVGLHTVSRLQRDL